MLSPLKQRLNDCTVRIDGSKKFVGSGFFLHPGWVATCKHVVTQASSLPTVVLSDKRLSPEAVYLDEDHDLAFLRVAEREHNYVYLDSRLADNHVLYSWGFLDLAPKGESLFLKSQGVQSEPYLIRALGDEVYPGRSGSPLLNLNTGGVCGMLDSTRGRGTTLGGLALPSAIILEAAKKQCGLLLEEDKDNRSRWLELLKNEMNVNRKGLGSYDRTGQPEHFYLLPHHDVGILAVYVEPVYSKLRCDLNSQSTIEEGRGPFLDECLKILDYQDLLLITGSYGSGKTLLTKLIQKRLLDEGIDSIFLQSRDIAHLADWGTFLSRADERRIENNKLIIVCDGFEEIQYIDPQRSQNAESILRHLVRLSREKGFAVVVNCRDISEQQGGVVEQVGNELFGNTEINTFEYIRIEPFKKKEVNTWLEKYSKISLPTGNGGVLNSAAIEKVHKNLSRACLTPLFLYILASKYREETFTHIQDVYSLYEHFVKETVKGKFTQEWRGGMKPMLEVCKDYRQFLREVAKKIDHQQEIDVDLTQIQYWYLDGNTKVYGIRYEDIQDIVEETRSKLFQTPEAAPHDLKLVGTLLSCYFFQEYDKRWSFRDNNVLLYLLAEETFEALVRLASCAKTPIGFRTAYEHFLRDESLCLHPLAMGLLFMKMKNDPNKPRIKDSISGLIDGNYVLRNTGQSIHEFTYEKLKADLVLVLTYLQLGEVSLDHYPHFFSDLDWYLFAAREIDHKLFDTARRFHKGMQVRNGEIERLDLTGYNLEGACLEAVTFEQSRFAGALMDDIEGKNVHFRQCSFDDVSMRNVTGSFTFWNCIVNKLSLSVRGNTSLRFIRCYVQWLQVFNDDKKGTLVVTFKTCDIDNFLFRNARSGLVKLDTCVFSPLKLESSKLELGLKNSQCKSQEPKSGYYTRQPHLIKMIE